MAVTASFYLVSPAAENGGLQGRTVGTQHTMRGNPDVDATVCYSQRQQQGMKATKGASLGA